MFDPIAQGLAAVSSRSVYAAPLAFSAGALSSLGPCVAPRFIAIAGLTAGKTPAQARSLAFFFITGLTLTYAAFGVLSTLLSAAGKYSAFIYILVAAALAAGGLVTLWREPEACGHLQRCKNVGAGGSLLLGASFALVVSPCCTPLVLGILAYTSASGSIAYGSAILACFSLGHALPIAAAAFGVNATTMLLQRRAVAQAAGVVSATLMLALSGYYAVLA